MTASSHAASPPRQRRLSRQMTLALVVLITLFGAVLRLYNLNAVSLRGDEAFTVLHWMREPLSQTVANIATVDPQGPFNYALYRAYALVIGTDPEIVRFLPALVSILGVPIVFALMLQFGHDRLMALIAAFLWAINPVAIYHAQDARSYAIWSVASPLALWLGLRALSQRGRGSIDWLLYIAAATFALYVYYLETFSVIALNLSVLLMLGIAWRAQRSRVLLVKWAVSQLVILILILPWYTQPQLLSGGGYGGTTSGFDWVVLIERFVPMLVFGEVPAFTGVIATILVLLLIFGTAFVVQRGRRAKPLPVLHYGILFFGWLIPIIGLAVVSTRLNVFAPRYLLSVSIILVLWCAINVREVLSYLSVQVQMLQVRVQLLLVIWIVLVLVFLTSYSISLVKYYTDYAKAPDWRGLTAYLSDRVEPADALIQAAADEAFTLYCLDASLSSDCDQKIPANPNQSASEIRSLLTMRSMTARSIWYVAQTFPDWQNQTVALEWLYSNMQLVREARVEGLPAYQFMPWRVGADEIVSLPLATFPNTAVLDGARWSREPDDTLSVWLIWRPLRAKMRQITAETPKVFVHLLDESGSLVAQDDHYLMEHFQDNDPALDSEYSRDIYHLPLDADTAAALTTEAPGGYRIAVGFYDPVTTRRLLLNDGTDAYLIPLDALE